MKLTKTCMYPWSFMQIHAGGMMQPCAVGPDTDFGDFLIDYFDLHKDGKNGREDFLQSKGLQMLREGILTGNLRPMCQNCFFVSNDLITIEEFEKRLKAYFRKKLGNEVDFNNMDFLKLYAYDWMAVSFTNRCNLRCIYCVQSIHAETNPYFRAEIPYEYADEILEMMAEKGISKISTCVEGEATLYKHWRDAFSKFHANHPDIKMYMTTNFNREYSDEDMDLLSEYYVLDISMDSLKPELYSYLRRNGDLDLILKNLDKLDAKVKEKNGNVPNVMIHIVVSTLTWSEIEDIADYAFDRGYGILLGNYEIRANTVAFRDGLLEPVEKLSQKDQEKMRDMVARVVEKAKRLGRSYIIQGDIFTKVNKSVERNYNRFSITDNNPIYEKFLETYPKGTKEKFFDVVYDRDNVSYAGIRIKSGESIILEGFDKEMVIVYREVNIYKYGKKSKKSNHNIEPRFRKKMIISGIFEYSASKENEDVDSVLLDISEFWENNGELE